MPPLLEAGPGAPVGSVAPAVPWWRRLRIIPRLDEMPRLLNFARTVRGRLVIVAIFTGLLWLGGIELWWQTGIVLALISVFPAQRWLCMTVAALWWVHLEIPVDVSMQRELLQAHGAGQKLASWPVLALVAAWYGVAAGYTWAARRFPKSPVGQRPMVGLLVILFLMLLTATRAPHKGVAYFTVAASAIILSKYIWFFAYSISAATSRNRTPFWRQIGTFRPFWGFQNASPPMAKGYAYQKRVEAADDAQFAKAQLKGLKLLLWALVLQIFKAAMTHLVIIGSPVTIHGVVIHGWVPTYPDALISNIQGHPVSWPMRWLVIIVQFVSNVAVLTVSGHKIIATCRMAGFAAARNTYRPFTSMTIAEFYNRIYYYFKELLVDFFFYPTYLRYFKRHARLRLFMATLAAAGLGNFIVHFIANYAMIMREGLWQAIKNFHVYMFYCLVLGVAIGVSQHRSMTHKRKEFSGFGRVRAIAGVLTFYAFLTIFDTFHATLVDCDSYFVSLFRP